MCLRRHQFRNRRPNKGVAANRRYAIELVSHWFYNNIDFGGRALLHPLHPPQGYGGRAQYCFGGPAAPVAELDR
jgi:hypothetical protein